MGSARRSAAWFTESEAPHARELWAVYSATYGEMYAQLLAATKEAVGPTPPAARAGLLVDTGRERSFTALERAFAGDVDFYEAYLCARARDFAARAIPFGAWFAIATAAEDWLRPLLLRRFLAEPERLEGVLRALRVFLSFTLVVLGEEYIRASESRKVAILEASPDPIVSVDGEGRVIEINGAAERTFGLRSEALLGQKFDLVAVPPGHLEQHRARFAALAERASASGLAERDELVLRRADGGSFPALVSVARIDTEGRRFFTGFIHDLTAERRASAELQKGKEEAEAASRALLATQEALRALTARGQAIREEESQRIAREVHDVLGQALTGLKLDLGWLARRIAGGQKASEPDPTDDLAGHCSSMIELTDRTLDAVRRIASELRPAVLDDLGIEAALEWQAADFTRRTGIAVDLDVAHTPAPIGAAQATTLFRIAQEALTNVARHANARGVRLTLQTNNREAVLVVKDDGVGLAPPSDRVRRGLGVLGMRERAAMLGGSVALSSGPEGGTEVVARVPVPVEAPG